MPTIHSGQLPQDALLNRYAQDGSFTDCYYLELPQSVSMQDYIAAFYSSRLFRIERALLSLLPGKYANDSHAKELALGRTTQFSAWQVEDRTATQLLLRDFLGRTRSWLMVEPLQNAGAPATRLYFGSAAVAKSRSAAGKPTFGFLFNALTGFHHLYSKALLRSAQSRLARSC